MARKSKKPQKPRKRPATPSSSSEDSFQGFDHHPSKIANSSSGHDNVSKKQLELDRILDKYQIKAQQATKQISHSSNTHASTKASSSRRANSQEAIQEAIAGFRPKHKSKTSTKPAVSIGSKPDEWSIKSIAIRQLLIMPFGTQDDDISHLPSNHEISFPNNLGSYTEIDVWLRSLLPNAFNEMELHDLYEDSHIWSLIIPHRNKFSFGTDEPTSVDLRQASGGRNKGWLDRALYFTTTFPIPDLVSKLEKAQGSTGDKKGKKRSYSDIEENSPDPESSSADTESDSSERPQKKARVSSSDNNHPSVDSNESVEEEMEVPGTDQNTNILIVISDDEISPVHIATHIAHSTNQYIFHSTSTSGHAEELDGTWSSPPPTSTDPWAVEVKSPAAGGI
ncbi:hypothetical protein M422DRAFT_242347 [Sphaerobolus stellatus SS14]|nr:hypothetical protein M422DRAFT_242347 [Sphaerobolus stellatus SS14]